MRPGLGTAIAALFVVCGGASAGAAPGRQALSPVSHRIVETLYSGTTHTTQVVVTLTPHAPDGRAIPVNLVLAAQFSGNQTRAVPISTEVPLQITLLAAASPTAVLKTAVPTIELTGDDGRALTLSAPGAPVRYGAPCGGCSDTSVQLLMNASTLLALASSHDVSGTVFAMPAHFDHEDLDAVRVFAYYIGVWK